ncbi:MAG: response regulator [Candidatus Sumerlaeia bacterium]
MIPPKNSAYPMKYGAQAQADDAYAGMQEHKVRVLIVDDDITVLTLLEEVFKGDATLQVETMSDSEAAYARVETEKFDLLITDLVMPKVDGLKLLEHAIAENPEILVVVITGYASLETTLEAIHAGVYDYITKPFRIEEFRLLVNNAAARIRLVHENRALRKAQRESNIEIENYQQHMESLQGELARLQEELGRREELIAQRGGTAPSEIRKRANLSSYEKSIETPSERFDREFQNLERLFSEGRLTPAEFETARQRLKTLV